MQNKQINILGSEYKIVYVESQKEIEKSFNHLEINCDGICLSDHRIILIRAFDDAMPYSESEGGDIGLKYSINRSLRHEILHAYLNECGLRASANSYYDAWSRNEEMIDWFAVLAPKIFKTYEELGILTEV